MRLPKNPSTIQGLGGKDKGREGRVEEEPGQNPFWNRSSFKKAV